MAGVGVSGEIDEILHGFVRARDEAEGNRILEALLREHAEPISRGILRGRLLGARPFHDLEDLSSEVRLRLLKQLRELRAKPDQRPIRDFHRYVATVTYHAWDEYLRQKYPRRARLKNTLRYLLTHREGFALWENRRHEWLAGLSAWRDGSQPLTPDGAAEPLETLVASLLEAAHRPIELDQLVSAVAQSWEMKDATVRTEADTEHTAVSGFSGRSLAEVEQRLYIETLWQEIVRLPVRQRAAVLLNLRDSLGGSAIELFTLLGVASIRHIATALEMPDERFAELWNSLPLEDAAIADILGITRQQVINLRKAARERLKRWAKSASQEK